MLDLIPAAVIPKALLELTTQSPLSDGSHETSSLVQGLSPAIINWVESDHALAFLIIEQVVVGSATVRGAVDKSMAVAPT